MAARAEPRAWQRMLSGRRLNLLDPSPLDVEIVDIAHGLARVARWNGQTHGPYVFSVAQHCLLTEEILATAHPGATPDERAGVLLHDAPEYVIGDMISPFKAAMGDTYKAVERRILQAVHARFSLPAPAPAPARRLKQADRAAAYLEATHLAGFDRGEARKLFGDPPTTSEAIMSLLQPVSCETVQARFLRRFAELEHERSAYRVAVERKGG